MLNKEHKASEMSERFLEEFGKHELAIERYYDHMLAGYAVHTMMIYYAEIFSTD